MEVGVDGCTNGWAAVSIEGESARGDLFLSLAELAESYRTAALILIDMLIGLRQTVREGRRCDVEGRETLAYPRSLSVFPVPLRPALAGTSRADADARSRCAGGPGVSCQSFGIS